MLRETRRYIVVSVVSVLDSGAEGPGFTVATLSGNSLRQTVHTHRAFVHQVAKLVAALLRVAGVTTGLAESNGSLPPGRVYDSHHLQANCQLAKNRDQLWNPTLGNRVLATFTSLYVYSLSRQYRRVLWRPDG